MVHINKETIKILNLILNENRKPSDISRTYKESKHFNPEIQKTSRSDFIYEKQSLENKCFKKKLEKQIIGSLNKKEFHIINIAQEIYPYLLREIFFSPPLLFCKGMTEILKNKLCIAIVGTRKCSKYGIEVARFLSRELSIIGFTIVSGMAIGIDRIAHETALNENGRSIGVLGTGIDIEYPPENKDLFKYMLEKGCLVTEFFPSVGPLKQNFPARNRIISGISTGVIIVEAGEKSGAVITARTAVKENREVFAVPGNIFSNKSCGCHKLIQSGAKLIHDIDDILIELDNYLKEYGSTAGIHKNDKGKYQKKINESGTIDLPVPQYQKKNFFKVLKCIGYSEKSFEEIHKTTNIDRNKLLQILSFLQLNDYIIEKSFNNYILNK